MDQFNEEPQICDYSKVTYITNSLITKTLILDNQDISQVIQSLKDKIAELESKLVPLTNVNTTSSNEIQE
jgi:hypothetical protein